MRVRCIKPLGNNPSIHVGSLYETTAAAVGVAVRYRGGIHVMPPDVFHECFESVEQ